MTTPELSYDTVQVKSTDVRGLRDSVFRAALPTEREFYVNLITKRNAATVGSFEPLR